MLAIWASAVQEKRSLHVRVRVDMIPCSTDPLKQTEQRDRQFCLSTVSSVWVCLSWRRETDRRMGRHLINGASRCAYAWFRLKGWKPVEATDRCHKGKRKDDLQQVKRKGAEDKGRQTRTEDNRSVIKYTDPNFAALLQSSRISHNCWPACRCAAH